VSCFASQADSEELQLPNGLSLPQQSEADVQAFDAAVREAADMRKVLVNQSTLWSKKCHPLFISLWFL